MEQNNRPDVTFVWNILDNVLRDTFRRNEYGDVVLPFVVLRRMDCILTPVNDRVRERYLQFSDKLSEEKLVPVLRKAAGGLKFYNTSLHTLTSLLDDARNVEINFRNYMNGFNAEVQDIFVNFQFDKVVARLNRNKLLYSMLQEMARLDLSPEKVDNHSMGYIFEELIRIANEQSNEGAGEHFTPRDAIRLMSALLFTPDAADLNRNGIIRTIYDPTCGTGGMVNVGREYIYTHLCDEGVHPTINTYGQEINEQSYAIAKSEALITGENADNIRLGNTLTQDEFPAKRFHYIMANPPYGVTWKKEYDFVTNESFNPEGRFYAGTPRVSDGQLLFLEHMLSKMEPGGSRVGVVSNGSPLFSGGAGSGESNIRKWIIDHDWLECIVALPKDLFYNCGIYTYIWILSNHKEPRRRGKVQLINAIDFCAPARKSLGNKRNDIRDEDIARVLDIYMRFEEGEHSRIFRGEEFGSLQLTIEQPKRDADGKLLLKKNKPQPDADKRDTEMVPLDVDVKEYFSREVLPHIDPESWIDFTKTRSNYEINFTRYFYRYTQPEPSADVQARILEREAKMRTLIKNLFED